MPVFQFEAINAGGERQTGLLDASSRSIASQSLQQQQLTPLAITEFKQKLSPLRRIPIAAICGFYTKLADLVGSEVPLLQSLRITRDATTNPQLKEILKEVHSQVTDGRNLSAALADHPRVFDKIAVSVIHAGLEGAFLGKALGELVQLYQRQQKVRSQVLGAVAYPAFLLCVGAAMLLSLIVFFVPQFAPMFDGLRERDQLPLLTDMLLAFSDSFVSNSLFVLVATIGGVMAIAHWFRKRNGARKVLSLLMRFRFPGQLIGNLALARFSRLLSALLKNGVTIDRSLRLCRTVTGNPLLAEAVAESADKVEKGGSLSEVLKSVAWISNDFTETIAVGEKSNRLGTVLSRTAEVYERETEQQINVLLRFLEPLLLLVMGSVMALFILAIMLPIFNSSAMIN
jgi:general secretion pathway protein F